MTPWKEDPREAEAERKAGRKALACNVAVVVGIAIALSSVEAISGSELSGIFFGLGTIALGIIHSLICFGTAIGYQAKQHSIQARYWALSGVVVALAHLGSCRIGAEYWNLI